jgi:hypothetical protein
LLAALVALVIGVIFLLWYTASQSTSERAITVKKGTAFAQGESLGFQDHMPDVVELNRSQAGVESGSVDTISEARIAQLWIRVVSAQHVPQPGAIVCIQTTNARNNQVVTCDEYGETTVPELEIGRISVRGLTSGAADLTLQPGMNELELVQTQAEDLVVFVVDADGAPIVDASVHVANPDDKRVSARVASTDTLGRCKIVALDARRSVFATKEGFEPSPAYPIWPMFLEAPRTLRIELAHGGYRLAGIVRAARTGRGVAGASVSVFGLRQSMLPARAGRPARVLGSAAVRLTRTDQAGRFTFNDVSSPPLRIEVLATDFAAYEIVIDEPPGGSEKYLEVQLLSGVELAGFIVDQGGAPVPDALVSLLRTRDIETQQPITTTTDQQGQFRFKGILAGAYRIEAASTSGRSVSMQLEIPVAEPVGLQLPTSPQASGRLLDMENRALWGWRVGWSAEPLVIEEGPFPRIVTTTERDGRFWLPDVGERNNGWLYAWPPVLVSMPILVMERRGNTPAELRAQFSVAELGSVVFHSDEPDRTEVVSAKLICVATGLGRVTGIDPLHDESLRGLTPGSYELLLRLGASAWKNGGRIELGVGQNLRVAIPPANVIDGLPAAH